MCTVLIVSLVVINGVRIGWMEAASRGLGMSMGVYIVIVTMWEEQEGRWQMAHLDVSNYILKSRAFPTAHMHEREDCVWHSSA
jgi:predicted Rossmann-fold nucleotide-binding protein